MMYKKQNICFELQMQFNIEKYIFHFSFTNNICTSKYNHLIKSRIEG
jgi:hypothetical protein